MRKIIYINSKINSFLIVVSIIFCAHLKAQTPSFANETEVTINGLTFDAMEPHLSADGNALFFNSLNDGITTSLYYAGKINDSVFNFIGLVPMVNQTVSPRLDGVASIDTSNNFYWVSTRNYPNDNLHRIRFLTSSYTNFGLVHGDFYIHGPGWLIMDAAVNHYGDKLIYCNAWFNSCLGGAPCIASMGIAQKVNDSIFNKMPNSDAWFANINDTTNYIVYAPFLSKDELELYYTRLLKNGTQTEIMVATRASVNAPFGTPALLISAPSVLPEGPALTSDQTKMYYHKKVGATFKLFYQTRVETTKLSELKYETHFLISPNPANTEITISNLPAHEKYETVIYTSLGQVVFTSKNEDKINISTLENGIYILKITTDSGTNAKFKIVKE